MLVSWVITIPMGLVAYLSRVIIHLLSTMDIPVRVQEGHLYPTKRSVSFGHCCFVFHHAQNQEAYPNIIAREEIEGKTL